MNKRLQYVLTSLIIVLSLAGCATFNIRFENEEDGSNAWIHRRDLVTELIRKYDPAILGTQEGKIRQLEYIRNAVPEYLIHAPNRVSDSTAQFPTLYVCRRDLDILEGDEFWLSKTPRSHRSKNWDSAFPRMLSYAKVQPKDAASAIWVAVTHLDHVGVRARCEQAKIIARWVAGLSGPLILMGDFNDHPGSDVHGLLTAPDTGLKDSWELLKLNENSDSFTYHGFDGVPRKTRMDWILVSSHFHVKCAGIVRDHRGGSYPSDHFPYMVDVEIKG
jgi:endonuclease/exonuclease/phosphatase family metal-dependent hydrolase